MCYDELFTEWFEDLIKKNPLEAHRNDDGEVQFTDTGDELIDSWEAQIAKGESPDFWQAFSPEAKEEIQKRLADAKAKRKATYGR